MHYSASGLASKKSFRLERLTACAAFLLKLSGAIRKAIFLRTFAAPKGAQRPPVVQAKALRRVKYPDS
jgi:hypothetical protein